MAADPDWVEEVRRQLHASALPVVQPFPRTAVPRALDCAVRQRQGRPPMPFRRQDFILIIHPLLKLAMTQPHLLGEHAEAYAALVGDEARKVSSSLALRIGLYAGAGVLTLIGLVLIGVALLLRASISSVDYPAGWALVVVPLTPFVVAAVMVFLARSKPIENAFDTVKKQIRSDIDLLREVSST